MFQLRLRWTAVMLIAPFALMAQIAPEKDAKEKDEKKEKVLELEKVETTGSRIRTLNGEATAMPVFTLSQVELEQRGVNRLADLRWAIPQLAPARGYNDNLGNGGTSRAQTVGTSINLRGLGNTTTLILIDGRRIPHTGQEAPGGAGGREDYNMDGIPVSAIDRVEVLTQGASAIYGADAITGVVNIILKKNFVGSEVRFSYDNTFSKDAAQKTVELLTGYASGKWRIFASLSAEKDNALWNRDRWFTATFDRSKFGNPTGGLNFDPGITGALYTFATPTLPGLTYNIVNIPVGSKGSSSLPDYAAAGPFVAGRGIDLAPYSTLIDPARKLSGTARTSYDVASWLELSVDARWNRTANYSASTPESLFITLPAGYAGNPFGTSVSLEKYFVDLTPSKQTSYFENSSVTVGGRGIFLTNWAYDAYFSFARNIVGDTYTRAPINSAALQAAMADPDPAKRPILAYDSSTPGANPNPAGYFDRFRLPGDHRDTSDISVGSVQANGPILTLPTGDLQVAAGVETQLEKVKFFRSGVSVYSFTLSAPFRRVTDAFFAETHVPLLSAKQHVPLVELIEFDAAVRREKIYDTKRTASVPTYAGIYKATKWLTFRGSRAEGFKEVRLYDLKAPVSNFVTTYTTSRNVRDTARGGELVLGAIPNISGGNPYLKPESSVSKSAGVVVDIPWIKGLSFSVDQYDIKYKDKSGSTSLQTLIDYFPERITRGPSIGDGLPGKIVGYDGSNLNLSYQTTKGLDYSVRYDRRTGWGEFSVTASMTVPRATFTKSTPSSALSRTDNPKRFSGQFFWTREALSAGTSVDYQGSYPAFSTATRNLASYIVWSPQVSYDFARDKRFAKGGDTLVARTFAGTKISATVVNAFKNEPDLNQAAYSLWIGDPRLTRYVLSLKKAF